MPEIELEYDDQGRVSGALRKHDVSHQMIEEFMLAANEAVAEHLSDREVPFLRRIHPAPDPIKLDAFREFARSLGYKVDKNVDRFTPPAHSGSLGQQAGHAGGALLPTTLTEAGGVQPPGRRPLRAGEQGLLPFHLPDSSLSRPDSPPSAWTIIRTGKAGSDETELAAIGEHCSKMERRAEPPSVN